MARESQPSTVIEVKGLIKQMSSTQGVLDVLDGVFVGRWGAGRAIWRFGADSSADYDLASLRKRDAGGG
jgi:hypothetical protein